jgi:hypothetical protein
MMTWCEAMNFCAENNLELAQPLDQETLSVLETTFSPGESGSICILNLFFIAD